MAKHGGPKAKYLLVALLSVTLGVTSLAAAPAAVARDNDDIRAPRTTAPDPCPVANDPLQAPRSPFQERSGDS